MSKLNAQEIFKTKNLFYKLQSLTFASLGAARTEDRGHLDVESQEILFRLKDNIHKLSDLSSRVEFMMGEISQVMKKGL